MTFYNSPKNVSTLLIEGVVVALLIALIYYVLRMAVSYKQTLLNDTLAIAMAGLLAHLLFEYTGMNAWYSKEYCKLL
jgi:hypothetical protein